MAEYLASFSIIGLQQARLTNIRDIGLSPTALVYVDIDLD